MLPSLIRKMLQMEQVVLPRKETGRRIVPSLDQMQRDSRQ